MDPMTDVTIDSLLKKTAFMRLIHNTVFIITMLDTNSIGFICFLKFFIFVTPLYANVTTPDY